MDNKELIIDEQTIVSGDYLNNDTGEVAKFRVKFRFRDYFSPRKMISVYKLMGGSGELNKGLKTIFKGSLKKHSTKDSEESLTYGMFGNKLSYEPIRAPWLYIRLLVSFFIIFGLAVLTDSWTLLIMIGSAIVPLTFLFFMYEINFPRNITLLQVIKCFFIGGLASILLTFVFREFTGYPEGIGGDFLTGFVEETAKILIAFFFIKMLKPRFILSGMLIGAAVGAGFDVFETAEYALDSLMNESYMDMLETLFIRGVLSIGAGHHFWTMFSSGVLTMIIGKSNAKISHLSKPHFLAIYLITIILHAMNNFSPFLVINIVICVIGLIITFMQLNVGITQYQIAARSAEINKKENTDNTDQSDFTPQCEDIIIIKEEITE